MPVGRGASASNQESRAGIETTIPARRESLALIPSGRKGLAAPAADPICSNICNWILNTICAVTVGLTAIFVCAWIAIDSLGTLAIGCGLFFIGVAIVVCTSVPGWACSQVCAW